MHTYTYVHIRMGFPGDTSGKKKKKKKHHLPIQETKNMLVRSLGQEDLEEGMATHSSILSWRTCVSE